jgi:pimeloyl-ACP methyl ester carboxylesterase
MGGKVAMYFEKIYPHLLSAMIVVDIASRFYPPHHEIVIKALNSVNFDEVNTRKEAERILENHGLDVPTQQFLLKNLYWIDPQNTRLNWRFNLEVISKNYNEIGKEVPYYESNLPVEIIYGNRSNYVNEQDKLDFAKRYSQAKFVEIDAGHWVHAEKPNEFSISVLNFIASL